MGPKGFIRVFCWGEFRLGLDGVVVFLLGYHFTRRPFKAQLAQLVEHVTFPVRLFLLMPKFCMG